MFEVTFIRPAGFAGYEISNPKRSLHFTPTAEFTSRLTTAPLQRVHCSWFGQWFIIFYLFLTKSTTFAPKTKCKNVQSCLNMLKRD